MRTQSRTPNNQERVALRLFVGIFVWSLCSGLATIAAAQEPVTNATNVGLPMNGVFDGTDFESVQITNGGLQIELPLWTTPGRNGLNVSFKYVYSSKLWSARETYNSRTDTWKAEIRPQQAEMLNGIIMHTAGAFSYGATHGFSYCGTTMVWVNYMLTEPSGTKHHFLPDPGLNGLCTTPLPTLLYADDGSGWALKIDPSTGNILYAIRKDGLVVINLHDTNGNQLTTSTDTLGRSIPSSLGYYDSTGTLRSIQVTNTSVPIQTSSCGVWQDDFCYEYSGTWNPPQTITLPNGLSYTFTYAQNQYGEPTSVTLPTGGTITWGWSNLIDKGGRLLASRTLTANGVSQTWQYGYSSFLADGPGVVTVTDPAGNITKYTLTYWNAYNSSDAVGYVTTVQYYQGSTTLLKTVQIDYTGFAAAILPMRETTTWASNNLVTKVETDYDNMSISGNTIYWGNATEKREYAYGVGAAGALVRKTHFNYLHLTNSTYRNLNIADRVTSKIVYDGAGNIVAQTNYTYDGSSLTSTSGTPAPNHDYTNFPSTFTYRGNLTQVSRGLKTGATWSWLNTNNTYDDLGNMRTTQDPRGKTTSFDYTDSWGDGATCTVGNNTFAYLTKTTDPMGHRVLKSYFKCMGLLQSLKDENDIANNRAGTTHTYDLVNRPLVTNYADGGQLTGSYLDTAPLSTTQSKLVSSGVYLQNTTVFDGLGRVLQNQSNDPDCSGGSGLVKVDRAYGFTIGAGRFTQVSTPYCNSPDSTYGLMTTTNYDALDRPTSVVQTDNSAVTTAYSANTAGLTSTVTDEAGKKRTNQTDALGRMTAVWEDPSGLNYETDYAYDTLNDLTSVTQKGGATSGSWRTRTFTYDSLGRLTCAANPEITPGPAAVNPASCPASYTGTYTNGTIGFSYDADGNLIIKTAPAPNQTSISSTVTSNYSYDNDNRLIQISYTGSPSTPTVQYGYNGIALTGCTTTPPSITPVDANPIHNRTSMCDGSGATSWSHDAMGRGLKDQRIINATSAINKSVQYTYFLDGEMNTIIYPSGRVMTYTPTTGGSCNGGTCTSGRAVSAGDGTTNYVSAAVYAPQGALASFTNDATIHAGFSYNSRMQPLQIAYGTGTLPTLTGTSCPTGANIMHLLYDFHSGSSTDNGNVWVINNCKDTNRTQNFVYDPLNRIWQAYTNGPNWGETFSPISYSPGTSFSAANAGIDAWGNLTNKSGVTGKTNTEPLNAAPASIKNQLNTFCNDAAGNLVLNSGCPTGTFTPTYSYDIENRLTSPVAGYSYVYDGDGQRVKKCSNAGCTTGTLYWVGGGSDPLTESSVAGTINEEYIFFNGKRVARQDVSGCVTNCLHYYFSDHLGSADVITSSAGAIQKEADYYPYGGEIVIFGGDINNYKFTGKERDGESGLDNFGARYNASNLGRFMTPDWAARPIAVPYAVFGDPQSLNLYGYVRNDPVSRADADGHSAGQNFAGVTSDAKHSDVASLGGIPLYENSEWNGVGSLWQGQSAQNQDTTEGLRDQIPAVTRAAMAMAIDDSDHRNGDDITGGFHEESGVAGQVSGGAWIVSRDRPGPAANPDVDEHAHITPVAAHKEIANLIVDPKVFFHVHPSGKTATHAWKQPPSVKSDLPNAVPGKINIVFGAGDHKVYFYNNEGVIGKPMKLQNFLGH